jgi:hypothetical protein
MKRVLVVVVLLALSLALSSSSVQAQSGPPVLTGETLVNGTLDITPTCNTGGTSTIEFKATGNATGPYPGTFTETGRATIGVQTQPGLPNDTSFVGPILAFDAVFTITSGDIQITGTKELLAAIPSDGIAIGQCFIFGALGERGEIANAITTNAVSYQARISTADGIFADSGGNPNADVQRTQFIDENPIRIGFLSFYEKFLSSGDSTVPLNTPGQVTGGGQISTDATFGLTAKSDANGMRGNCTVIDRVTDKTIKCLDVTAYVQFGTHASFSGNAKINGVVTTYRIDVDDLAEPGASNDTFSISTANGYVGRGVLTQGNIQIH